MNIEYMPLESLREYADNPRANNGQVKRMAAAIEEYGFKVPILVTSDNEVIDGHLRLKAARSLKMDTVPVVRIEGLTPEQTRALRLLTNRSVEWAQWDEPRLLAELDALYKAACDLSVTGLNPGYINKLFAQSADLERQALQQGTDAGMKSEGMTISLDPQEGPKTENAAQEAPAASGTLPSTSTDTGEMEPQQAAVQATLAMSAPGDVPAQGADTADAQHAEERASGSVTVELSSATCIRIPITGGHVIYAATPSATHGEIIALMEQDGHADMVLTTLPDIDTDAMAAEFIFLDAVMEQSAALYGIIHPGRELDVFTAQGARPEPLPLRHVLIWELSGAITPEQPSADAPYPIQHRSMIYTWKKTGSHHYYRAGQFTKSVWTLPPQSNTRANYPAALAENALLNSTMPGQVALDPYANIAQAGALRTACIRQRRRMRCVLRVGDLAGAVLVAEQWNTSPMGRQGA